MRKRFFLGTIVISSWLIGGVSAQPLPSGAASNLCGYIQSVGGDLVSASFDLGSPYVRNLVPRLEPGIAAAWMEDFRRRDALFGHEGSAEELRQMLCTPEAQAEIDELARCFVRGINLALNTFGNPDLAHRAPWIWSQSTSASAVANTLAPHGRVHLGLGFIDGLALLQMAPQHAAGRLAVSRALIRAFKNALDPSGCAPNDPSGGVGSGGGVVAFGAMRSRIPTLAIGSPVRAQVGAVPRSAPSATNAVMSAIGVAVVGPVFSGVAPGIRTFGHMVTH